MSKKYIVAAVLALSLSGANVHAAEASVDLGVHIQQVIAEIHHGTADWQKMLGRIDRLVAHIDLQIEEGVGNYEELTASRQRLVEARQRIQQQHLTAAQIGEAGLGPAPAAPCEVCGATHSAPVASPPSLDGAVVGGGFESVGSTGGFSTGGGVSGGGGFSTGGGVAGGGGLGGFGRLGLLGGVAAAIATSIDDDDDTPGVIASPSNP